ncbi:MAG: Class II abasic (AP) endonuclease [Cirrosporium novae-zelandiae]|nr:MAG: Class II abasic (AP) endonuclease [Cirrosporium novae-zelandiae]
MERQEDICCKPPFSIYLLFVLTSPKAMFDLMEADIVVFQETKIQRKDLRDDMVLVPGWDCFFSLPKFKKGYSGVVIYTRDSSCVPVRAEEGITGALCSPNSTTSFIDLPSDQRVGGYPTLSQLGVSKIDPATLDSEGRCVILEFPAFVLLGVYAPAHRDQSRDEFRMAFLSILDFRIRNLTAMGKRVVVAGDLNISRNEMDTANADEYMRKNNLSTLEFISTPARRLLNQLLVGGSVHGIRDEGRGQSVMWDICREFHPFRKGMFTCWEQKINARPGNYGSRIDYVLCSKDMRDWVIDSNIQEGLMGSDHCPVYVVFKDHITIDGVNTCLQDAMNVPSTFKDGKRLRGRTSKDLLSLSGRCIPEFNRRQNIIDMFKRNSSMQSDKPLRTTYSPPASQHKPPPVFRHSSAHNQQPTFNQHNPNARKTRATDLRGLSPNAMKQSINPTRNKGKRSSETTSRQVEKRTKLNSNAIKSDLPIKGQQSLMGFFKRKELGKSSTISDLDEPNVMPEEYGSQNSHLNEDPTHSQHILPMVQDGQPDEDTFSIISNHITQNAFLINPQDKLKATSAVPDKESWSKIFSRRVPPKCESHGELCICLQAKKSGINQGRSFWICSRPLGPSGHNERASEWRCGTFIWCSDWNRNGKSDLGLRSTS